MVLDCKEQPFGVALWGARLLTRVGLLLAFFWGQPVASATPAMELYEQYKREANEADTPEARARVYTFWEKQFDDFLSREAPDDGDRLTLMAERGALLVQLDRHEEAIGAWLALDQAAADLGNLRLRIEALDSAWRDVRRVPKFEEKVLVAIQRCLDDMLNASTMPPPQSMSRLAQVCEEVSRTYWRNASIQAGQQEKRQMLERAEVWGKKSLVLLPAGDKRIPNVRFLLGRVQAELGKGLEAADQFDEMLESGQSRFATTWVAHWRLKAVVPVDTAEYVDGIQEILRKYEEDDYLLTLKQELARSLFAQKRYAEAAEVFEWLIGRDPSDGPNATNMYLLAGAYEYLGRQADAQVLLNEVLRKYPETGAATKARERLEFLSSRGKQIQAPQNVANPQVVRSIKPVSWWNRAWTLLVGGLAAVAIVGAILVARGYARRAKS